MRAINMLIVFCFLSIIHAEVAMAGNIVDLPKPRLKGNVSLEEVLAARRSQRNFTEKELTLQQVGQLLWAAQGITGKKGGLSLRTAPSAGALYPLEVYAVAKDALYHYLPEGHKAEVIAERDLRRPLAQAALSQSAVGTAAVDIVICGVFSRITKKYGESGRLYTYTEAGHVAQNIHLEAVALGLGSVPVGAFDSEAVQKCLSLPRDHEPLYIISVGYPR